MKRPVGRPRIARELKRLPRKFYLNEYEFQKVKEIVKCLKERKEQEEIAS